MKKLILFSLIMLMTLIGFSQKNDSTTVIVEKETIVTNNSDTTKINFGNYKIIVIEKDDNTEIKVNSDKDADVEVEDHTIIINRRNDNKTNTKRNNDIHNDNGYDDDNDNDNDSDDDDDDDDDICSTDSGRRTYKTRTNWGGLSYGYHQLLNDASNTSGSTNFVELESGSSWAWEFLSLSVPLGSPYVSLTTGLGVRWDKYQLSEKYRINPDESYTNGQIEDHGFQKNILRSNSLEIPVLLNISTSKRKKSNLRISVGYIQRIGLKSKAKYKFSVNGEEKEETIRDDFNLRKFNGMVTARIGYRAFMFYGNYGLNSIFEDNKGPVLNPLTIGVSMRIIPVMRWSAKYKS